MSIPGIRLVRTAAIALGAVGCAAMLAAPAAQAGTIGVAVSDFTASRVQVGTTVARAPLGGQQAIEYYIPLSTTYGGVYGVTPVSGGLAGMVSDVGSGAGTGVVTLTMNLEFTPVSTTQASVLTIDFEDLDLDPINDPNGFFESLQVFDDQSNPLTPLITQIGGLITGNGSTQHLSLDLGLLTSTTFFAQLTFGSDYTNRGSNTPEYLVAQVSATGPTLVPSPGTLALFGTAIILLGMVRRRPALRPALRG